jgi:hypothetical protein
MHADGSKHVVMATSESRAKRQKQPSIDQRDNSTPYILWGSACLSRRAGRRAAAGLARLWRTTNAAPYLVCTCHRSRLQGPTAPGQPVGTTADATVRRRASVPAVARINGLESNVISRGDRRARDGRATCCVRDAAARAERRRALRFSYSVDQHAQIDILSTVFIVLYTYSFTARGRPGRQHASSRPLAAREPLVHRGPAGEPPTLQTLCGAGPARHATAAPPWTSSPKYPPSRTLCAQ